MVAREKALDYAEGDMNQSQPQPATKAEQEKLREMMAREQEVNYQAKCRMQSMSGAIFARLLGESSDMQELVKKAISEQQLNGNDLVQALNSISQISIQSAAFHAKHGWGMNPGIPVLGDQQQPQEQPNQ